MRAYVVFLSNACQRQLETFIMHDFIALIGMLLPHEYEEDHLPNLPQNVGEVGQMEMSGLSHPWV